MWLIVRTGPDAGSALELPEDRPFVLGRQQGCDMVVRDTRASRRHAELAPDGGARLRLRDLGSANGTYVDGRRVEEALLDGGEELRIGDVIMDLSLSPPTASAPVPSGEADAAATEHHELATASMVRRLVDQGAQRSRRIALVAAGVALAAVVAVLVIGGGDDDEVPQVVAAVAPSTVLVETQRLGARTGTGSGWVLDASEGLVVTNAHVINQGDTFRVAGREATVVAAAPCEDLALLKVADRAGL